MKEEGIKIELQKEFLFNNMQAYASLNKGEAVEDAKKQIAKLLFPDVKDQTETLFENAKMLSNTSDKLRISVDTDKKLDPYAVNQQFNKG